MAINKYTLTFVMFSLLSNFGIAAQQQHAPVNKQNTKIETLALQQRDSVTNFQREKYENLFRQQYGDTVGNWFYRAIMESPLYYPYSPSNVWHSFQMARLMGFDNPAHKDYHVYKIYADLLQNYQIYNQELVDLINKIIQQLEYFDVNRELAGRYFEGDISRTQYYKIRGKDINIGGKGKKYGEFRHIYYLDHVIAGIREIFAKDSMFSKKNFEIIRDKLISGMGK